MLDGILKAVGGPYSIGAGSFAVSMSAQGRARLDVEAKLDGSWVKIASGIIDVDYRWEDASQNFSATYEGDGSAYSVSGKVLLGGLRWTVTNIGTETLDIWVSSGFAFISLNGKGVAAAEAIP
jgi:hypothetical protein